MKTRRKKYISAIVALPGIVFAAAPAMTDAFSANTIAELRRAGVLAGLENYQGELDRLRSIACEQLPMDEAAAEDFLSRLGQAYYGTNSPRCIEILNIFLSRYPASVATPDALRMKGNFYFFAHDYSEALECYKLVDYPDNLTRLRYGISLARRGFYKEAREIFNQLSRKKNFATLAGYYTAYIDYVENDDVSAMKGFRAVQKALRDKTQTLPADEDATLQSKQIYPDFYISQLLFRNGDWNACAREARKLLREDIPDGDGQMRSGTLRVLGMSLYKLDNLEEARPYLQQYVDIAGPDASDDAMYALGSCCYNAGDYSAAQKCFSPLLDAHDVIAQGAYLYLGQIEAAEKNPSTAALNFEKAYRMNYDNKVAETALYNYAAACSNGGNIPFDSSRDLLEIFLESFPDSEYAPGVERYMASTYYKRGEYDEALRVIDKIRRPTSRDVLLKQAILYSAGAAMLSSGDASKSADFLKRCVALKGADPSVQAQANVWLGDALYDMDKYAAAENAYKEALNSGKLTENRDLAIYDLGYALLRQKKFSEAGKYFGMLEKSTSLTGAILKDASLQLADCKYYTRDYAAAQADFRQLREDKTTGDYATYRYAQIIGLQGDMEGKVRELEGFLKKYPSSTLMSKGLSELADAYVAEGNAARAAEINRKLLLQFPASSEAALADKELRRFYTDTQNVDEYASFIKSVPGYEIDNAQLDDMTFESAENAILDKKRDAGPISNYIKEYPSGHHIAEAWNLYADYLLDEGRRTEALKAYKTLERTGGMKYAGEAYAGIMRSTSDAAECLVYARKVKESGGVSLNVIDEASLYEAESLIKTDTSKAPEVEKMLVTLAENPFTETGAHANVLLADIDIANKKPDAAISKMESFTSSGSPQQYWVARGFINLAKAYKLKGKDYLAKEYLLSLKENYPGKNDDIHKLIDENLKSLK